ncbi:MAG: ABC transporter substrate-binding protein [Chloroflexi bacterium]|nr:ABC transporter substrate-binding protein [Chloroflexota bacterium]
MSQPSEMTDLASPLRTTRRRFLRSVAALGSVAFGGSLLAACQTAPPAPPTAKPAESKPTEAPKPAAPASPGAASASPAAGASPAASPAAGGSPAASPAAAPAAKPAAAAPAGPKPPGRLVYANPSKLRTLDTITQYGLQEFQISRQIMEPLLDLDQNGKLTPVLAESWQASDGGKTWTFKLRKGVVFHDGSPFDAKSVQATVKRAKAATISQHKFAFVDFEDEPVQIVDDFTVAFKSKSPTATLPYNLVAVYMQPAALASDPKYDKEPMAQVVGTGPFKLVKLNVDGDTQMEANTSYWQSGLPKVGELIHRPVPEPSAMVAAVKAGEIDLAEGISIDLLPTLQSDANLQLIQSKLWQIDFFILNTTYEPLKKPQVRQAISFAIDRDTLTKDVYGAGVPIASYPPKGLVGFSSKLPGNPYDAAKAKALLKEAGYENGFDLDIVFPAGTYIKDKEVAQFVGDQLKQVGIRAKVISGEANATRNGYREGQYQMGMLSSIAVTGDADRYMQERLVQDINKSGYKDEKVVSLIKQAASETDSARRQALYEEIQDIMWQGPPVIYLYQIDWTYAARKTVQGFNWMPNRIFNLATVSKG